MLWLATTLLAASAAAAPAGNTPPVADAGVDFALACEVDGGATAVLDGTASKDADSTPGTSDDIVAYRWSEGGATIGEGTGVPVVLAVGVHEITLTVTDAAGATGSDTVTVTVDDTTPPVIACAEAVEVACDAAGGAHVDTHLTAAKDTCFRTAVVTNDRTDGGEDASGWYPVGVTTVAYVATDAAGNTATCTSTVTVVDAVAPVARVAASPATLAPPNHALRAVHVDVVASDVCDPAPEAVLVSVVSSEPDDAPGGGDGATAGDIRGADVGTPDFDLWLRAERQGNGPGRRYTLVYRVTDASGNVTTATGEVVVPH